MCKEKWEIRFSECEHEGDLDNYASELQLCGAEFVDQQIDSYEDEEGVITVVITAGKEFGRKIAESDIDGFIDCRTFICKVD